MLALWGNIAETVFAICKFLAIYRTVIIAFSLKRYCSILALLKSVLSVQIDPLLDHIICSTSIEKKSDHVRRRVARIWKRGGYFERVRSVQTTLTRIVIALESVSHGLHENWDEISRKPRKFKGFFRPKSGGLQKKKKGLHRFGDWFFGRNLKFKGFFRPKSGGLQKKKKKKGLHRIWDWLFGTTRNS